MGIKNNTLDLGVAVLRVGIGVMMFFHGLPKLTGGPETWEKVGAAMGDLGVSFMPAFWGFMAAISETIGGAFLAVGFLVRPSLLLLMVTMVVATVKTASGDGSFISWSRPVEMFIVFLGLFIAGAGKFSLDSRLFGKKDAL